MGYKDLMKNYTYRQLRTMYNEAARQARGAYQIIEKAYPGSEVVEIHKGDFKSFSTISKAGLKKEYLAKELTSVERFLRSSASDLERYEMARQETIEKFHASGYDFVNNENLDALQQFMRDVRARGLVTPYGSDQLVEAFNFSRKEGITAEQFAANIERWEKNAEKVQSGAMSKRLRMSRGGGSWSFVTQ